MKFCGEIWSGKINKWSNLLPIKFLDESVSKKPHHNLVACPDRSAGNDLETLGLNDLLWLRRSVFSQCFV